MRAPPGHLDAVAAELAQGLDDRAVAYAHLHNTKPGCYAASAHRVD